jgi:hypothetical protein
MGEDAVELEETGARAGRKAERLLLSPLLVTDEPIDGVGEAFFLVRGRDVAGGALHLGAGVAHRDAGAGDGEHQHVVGHVADHGDLLGGDLQVA